MPILPREPFLYPEHLFTAPAFETVNDNQWWVVHTKPRAEKSLARRLIQGQYAFFLPLLTRSRVRTSKSRSLDSHVPLFPSYVFIHGSNDSRVATLSTNLAVQVIPVVDQERLQHDLSNVHRLMVQDVPLTSEDKLVPGTPVMITEGTFAGLSGKVLRRGRSWHLFVEVNFLKCGVSVEIEQSMIKPLIEENPAMAGGL